MVSGDDDKVFIINKGREGVTLFILFAGVLNVLTMRCSLFMRGGG